jgi:TDG/mug DNA glycosylase family protein
MPVLPDVLRPGLRVVFCGTAAGAVSAAVGAYYAGPGNKFWRMLHETGLTPTRLEPLDFRAVLDHGIGLTDLAKEVSGADSVLPRDAFDVTALLERIGAVQPEILAFNGKKAAAIFHGVPTGLLSYGPAPERPDFPPVWVLPSTSGLASRAWDPSPWHALAAVLPEEKAARNGTSPRRETQSRPARVAARGTSC